MEKFFLRINKLLAVSLKKFFNIEEKRAKTYAVRILQFVKFGVVGLSNTLISYIVYLILYTMGVNYLVSSIFGFLVSVINAFYWNNKYVFKQEEKENRNLVQAFLKTLVAYAGTGLILNNILLVLWVEMVGIPKLIAPAISLLITIPLNFILNKFWTFKRGK